MPVRGGDRQPFAVLDPESTCHVGDSSPLGPNPVRDQRDDVRGVAESAGGGPICLCRSAWGLELPDAAEHSSEQRSVWRPVGSGLVNENEILAGRVADQHPNYPEGERNSVVTGDLRGAERVG
jgi:hypothetical protein